jgi:hypothetical protein
MLFWARSFFLEQRESVINYRDRQITMNNEAVASLDPKPTESKAN